MAKAPLNLAIEELLASADLTAKKHAVGPVEILVFAAAYGLMPHMSLASAKEQFDAAWRSLEQAGAKSVRTV